VRPGTMMRRRRPSPRRMVGCRRRVCGSAARRRRVRPRTAPAVRRPARCSRRSVDQIVATGAELVGGHGSSARRF
jgi:hypothetical protein